MQELLVTCGLSGSGKTTYAKWFAETLNYIHISSDDIRAEFGDVNDQSHNNEVFKIFYERIQQNLSLGNNIIADATFLTIKERRRILEIAKQCDCQKNIVIIATPINSCLKNNRNRNRIVPEDVIYKQRNKFQIPFIEEGWNQIILERKWFAPQNLDYFIRKMIGFNQKNPHHSKSLLLHSIDVAEQLHINGYDYIYGLLHDFGKLFTQSFDKEGIAHYYNHENVGAYEILNLYEEYKHDLLDLVFLVNYHMLPFGWKTDKVKEKWRLIFGDEKFQMLMDFHECDIGVDY